jgi:hypothetical protein
MEFVLSNIVNGLDQNNLSPLEKVMWAYDNVKTLQYVKKENIWDEKRIPEIIMDGKATCVGFGELFSEILNRCGINCYGVHTNTHEPHYRNIAEVSDEKYGINGIYMFDPTWDSVSYSNDPIIRLMPYDYFCRRISDLNLLKDKEDVSKSLLGVLNSSSLEEAVKRAREVFPTQKDYGTRSLTLDENAITDMYNKATNAPKLSEEALAQCMAVVRSKQYPDFSKDKIVSWVEDSMEERERMQSKLYNDPIIEDRVMQ